MKKSLPLILLVVLFAIVIVILLLLRDRQFKANQNADQTVPDNSLGFISSTPPNVQFVPAARAATPAVVHIKTTFAAEGSTNPLYELYGIPQDGSLSRGSGSGVTISEDGYIATNNHVVENASAIEVIFPDKRIFEAKLIGRDPSTDLALIKVDARDLPVVKMGNSDRVEVGEWVLAIGYPFSLNTTVTAGIVSAKGRSIGILNQPRRQSSNVSQELPAGSAIESFIQTDAAINPGNSGGALVNTNGELIGINAAIASQTGSYAGYGFAIPSNLVQKILDDLREFGEVRRGYLGVSFPAPLAEEQFYRQQDIDPASVKGVLITGVQEGSAAAQAGLKEGDIVQQVDGVQITSAAEFSERIARHRPNDEIELTYLRNGKTNTVKARLKGEESLAQSSKQSLEEIYNRLGASFTPLTDRHRRQYGVPFGVVVKEVRRGGLFDQVGIAPATIITLINGRPVRTPQDIDEVLSGVGSRQVRIDGIAPDGSRVIFTFSMGA